MKKNILITNDIRDQILKNKLTPGTKLPTEQELSVKYGVSKITIKKAIDTLVFEGLIFKQSGKGTFVTDSSAHIIDDTNKKTNEKVVVKLFEFIISDDDIQKKLHLPHKENVLHYIRIRYLDNNIMNMEESYIPFSYATELTQKDIETSVFDYFNRVGISPKQSSRDITMKLAQEKEQDLLEVELNHPLGIISSIVLSSKAEVIQYTESTYKYENFKTKAVIQFNG